MTPLLWILIIFKIHLYVYTNMNLTKEKYSSKIQVFEEYRSAVIFSFSQFAYPSNEYVSLIKSYISRPPIVNT